MIVIIGNSAMNHVPFPLHHAHISFQAYKSELRQMPEIRKPKRKINIRKRLSITPLLHQVCTILELSVLDTQLYFCEFSPSQKPGIARCCKIKALLASNIYVRLGWFLIK